MRQSLLLHQQAILLVLLDRRVEVAIDDGRGDKRLLMLLDLADTPGDHGGVDSEVSCLLAKGRRVGRRVLMGGVGVTQH